VTTYIFKIDFFLSESAVIICNVNIYPSYDLNVCFDTVKYFVHNFLTS